MVSQLLRCHGSPEMGVRKNYCVLCLDYMRADGCKFQILFPPPNSIRGCRNSWRYPGRVRQWWGPQTSMPTNLGSSPPSSSLSGWSKASCEIGCNEGISGSIPPLTWRVKNLLLVGPPKTAGVPEAKDLGVKDRRSDCPKEAPRTNLPQLNQEKMRVPRSLIGTRVQFRAQPQVIHPSPAPYRQPHSLGQSELWEQARQKQDLSQASRTGQDMLVKLNLEALPQSALRADPGPQRTDYHAHSQCP